FVISFSFLFSCVIRSMYSFFVFTSLAAAVIYILSLHDALPICQRFVACFKVVKHHVIVLPANLSILYHKSSCFPYLTAVSKVSKDRKSTRLNSSHVSISYAVFCL